MGDLTREAERELLESARWKLRARVLSADKSRGYDNWPRITQAEAAALLSTVDAAARVRELEEEARLREESQIPFIPTGAKRTMDRLEARVRELEAALRAYLDERDGPGGEYAPTDDTEALMRSVLAGVSE